MSEFLSRLFNLKYVATIVNEKNEILCIRCKDITSITMTKSTSLIDVWYIKICSKETKVFELQFSNEEEAKQVMAELTAKVF